MIDIQTTYYIEFLDENNQWRRTQEIKDQFQAMKLVDENFKNGRVIRKVQRLETFEEICYPTLIEKYKGGYSL